MKKIVKIALIVAAVLAVLFFVFINWSKSHSPEATAEITSGDMTVSVKYCQPSIKGRTIFGELIPFGQVWRTGANEASVIKFNKDVTVGGQSLKAGEYSLWTIPNEGNWNVIFNSATGQWGTMYDSETDLLKVDAIATQTEESTEQFTISFVDVDSAGVNMNLKWDKTLVILPIE
jgi:lipopolysaccharide export LptBFGC system permease protein LptF